MSELDKFLADYSGDRQVTTIEVPGGKEAMAASPFIVLKFGQYAVVVNPMGIGDESDGYLDVDVHAFVGEGSGSAAVFGMTSGRRHEAFHDTGMTSRGMASVPLTVLMVGAQGVQS